MMRILVSLINFLFQKSHAHHTSPTTVAFFILSHISSTILFKKKLKNLDLESLESKNSDCCLAIRFHTNSFIEYDSQNYG